MQGHHAELTWEEFETIRREFDAAQQGQQARGERPRHAPQADRLRELVKRAGEGKTGRSVPTGGRPGSSPRQGAERRWRWPWQR